ncbi:MAG: hypothetical protein J0H88_24365 [Sphingomonadales bacterium]|nr:hypothetical protein [Sphingomonadales bacterium]
MLSLALTLLLSAAAPEATTAPEPTTNTAKPQKPKKICRNDDNTGSRLKKKTCRTQDEWNNQATDVRGDVRLGGAGGN